jgi:hypothetical protein
MNKEHVKGAAGNVGRQDQGSRWVRNWQQET